MSRWSFVGRAEQLDRLRMAVAGVRGRGILFTGSAGIGKSRLLHEGVDALPGDKYAVWRIAASATTSAMAFGGLVQVLPEQPQGLSPAGILRWAVDVLQQQAAGRRIVLAVDDAHLLDPPSAALVHLVARAENASVVGTLRDGEQIPLPIRALWTDGLVERAELGPLPPDETAAMLTAIVGGQVDSGSTDRLGRLSAGNPLLLRELVHAATNSGELVERYGVWTWTGRLELAPSLTELIDIRIGQLTPGVRAVVELVAFGEPLGLRLLHQAVEQHDVEYAEERGLITMVESDRRLDVRLAHPLYGEVVRRQCPVSRTRRLQAHLADLLEKVGKRRREDLLRVARWRLASGTAQDPAMLIAAAGEAFARYDVPLATRLARAALDAGGGFDAAELLATILMFADRPAEALGVLDAVATDAGQEERLSRWLTVRGMVSYWGLSQASTVEEIAAEGTKLTDAAAQARVRAFEAIMRLHRLDAPAALRLAQGVLDRPAASVAARELARCTIAHLQAVQGQLCRSASAVDLVQAKVASWRADMPYLQLAVELARGTRLALSGDLAGIDALVADEFADLADAGDFRLGTGYLAILRAYAARLRGRSDTALQAALSACAVLATSRVYAGLAQSERAQAAALRGDARQAAEAMAEADRLHSPTMVVLYPWLEQARAATLAAGGEPASAVKRLHDLVDRLRADGFAGHEALVLHDLVRLGQAAAQTGPRCSDGDRRTVAQRLTELSEQVDGELPPLLARHARASADGLPEELLGAADGFAERGLDLLAAEAVAEAVHLLRQRRSPEVGHARQRLGALLAGCDMVHTPALQAATPTLTDREWQVARLAAVGGTSRAIAEQLFLSARTVENHLQRVYTKLGVTSRAELRVALGTIPGHDGTTAM
ncbi:MULTISPECIES: LuxR family transcriptional regulator [unclassified Micromonospora]|uniref:LuxR C-terminal-related transcriptional regulator n=1 Tax=unclassified Micromonospora TaxID=2617518 RepID=UPI0022B69B8B|nr:MULTISPECIES: LuxR family transcriptional regulator [unclassified Micromonospora]MCZ7420643.1 LuxR C-terminal-related transcriptional regulator [Verrucosispora sp. WMMA2121]WBB88903.1 LuxR C-terminal-related transcriptional regulator [Verrucosispora sp. WMMC514]